MVQDKDYFAFINQKRKDRFSTNYQSCSNMMPIIEASFSAPLVLLWLSYRGLKWICSIFEDGLVAP